MSVVTERQKLFIDEGTPRNLLEDLWLRKAGLGSHIFLSPLVGVEMTPSVTVCRPAHIEHKAVLTLCDGSRG
ncbi:unnamed protein product [Staurois parvus]|uniref:Uncharacterized protein n=1 Tax=Staurois parvus TaxID=386267 RepID=A0ABN9FJB4_9NEOB|nr:unnamed protein product [Staurois parvus]